ncbi:MAG TPA: 3-phosphoshikimate 1-carboxyvinyltransferase, partial [Pirellulales bacterium]
MQNPLDGVRSLTISPVSRVTGSVTPPGSKSITNRAFVCAALSDGVTTLTGVLDSEDTRLMAGCLERLGFDVQIDWAACRAVVNGQRGAIPAEKATLDVGNSGTTARFISAMLALGQGVYTVDGVARMRERPIQDLLDALAQLGADARSVAGTGCPPVEIRATGIRGGEVAIRGDVSSQFLSGLVLAAPYARSPVRVSVVGKLVSVPYVTMTLAVMESFGARPRIEWTLDAETQTDQIRAIVVPPAV